MGKKEAAKSSTFLSTEFVADSSDEDSGHEIAAERPEKPKTERNKAIEKKSKELEERRKKEKAILVREASPSSASEANEDGGESVASPDESPTEDEVDKPVQPSEPPRKKAKTASVSMRSIPAKPYAPPKGFAQPASNSPDDSSQISQILTEDLSGKQVWHIIAPSSVSLASIEGFSLEAVRSGKPIISQNGVNYGFSPDANPETSILVPDGTGMNYSRIKTSTSRAYHLREVIKAPIIKLPSIGDNPQPDETGTSPFAASSLLKPKSTPAQPKGLRMRYRPFGTDPGPAELLGTSEESDSEKPEVQVPPQIPTPPLEPITPEHKRKKKHIHHTPAPVGVGVTGSNDTDQSPTAFRKLSTPTKTKGLKSPESTKYSNKASPEISPTKMKKKRKTKLSNSDDHL